ncbi:MAG: hypothetical protein AB7U83_23220 [Vicinamibacterales bacterium]
MSEPVVPETATGPTAITRGELLMLSVGMWLSGVCLLALLPVVLMPRLGPAVGLAVTYFLFFVAWQPLQRITQRAFGPRAAFVRTMTLVASAAVAAYYLREALLELLRRPA